MLTTIDLPPDQVESLDEIAAREQTSREALLRALIADYLARNAPRSDLDPYFRLWGERPINGLAYQDKLRAEW
ncbi:ribbon-helix-helix domain-containing protein [Methylobacterium oryzisoli]|uniref:ribbon-helix-helix domain-containing protein n=1 Tax=Methylobacterium oryzisoli TaxID=3385502 RepID=UPI00389229CA